MKMFDVARSLLVGMLGTFAFPALVLAQLGELDHTFGTHGVVLTSFTATDEGDSPSAIAFYPASSTYAGRFVVAGTTEDLVEGEDQFVVARYNADGSLDTTFNSTGYRTVSFGTYFDRCTGVAIQSDDKVVLVGTYNGYDGVNSSTNRSDLAIARINANGSMDTTFSGDGKLTQQIGSTYSDWFGVVVQKDGNILVGGRSGGYDCTIVKVTAAGAYQTHWTYSLASGSDFESISRMVLDDGPSGSQNIYATGYAKSGTDNRMMAMKINSSGTKQWHNIITLNGDGGGGDGIALYDYGSNGSTEVVVGGDADAGDDRHFAVAVLNSSDGSFYTSFSSDGKATVNINDWDQGCNVAVQTDGKIIVGNYADGEFGFARFNTNGSLDTTFGSGDGIATATTGGWEYPTDFALDNQGRLVAVGMSEAAADRDFAVLRFHNADKAMEYLRNDIHQVTGEVFRDTTVAILDAQVCVDGALSPLTATSFTFNTTGSTNPSTDIASAKLFYTGTTNAFSETGQFGSTINNPSGTMTFTGTQTLAHGDNHFWLAYTIRSSATYGNVVDAQCTSLTAAGSARTPNPTSPSGNRTVMAAYYPAISGDNSYNETITNLTFAGINKTTGAETGGYGDYTAYVASVDAGSGYTLSCTANGDWPTYPDYIRAWIDWNHNYSFDDPGESYDIASSITSSGPYSITVNVPGDAVAGNTRLRIAISDGWPPNQGNIGYGEAEDYTVSVTGANNAPVITQGAGPLSVTMSEDGAPTPWSAPTLGATDADPGDTLTWSVSSAASHGTATVSGTGASPTTFTYAPTANWSGSDSFTVRVSDGTDADTIVVNVTVQAVNDPPVITQGAGPLSVTMSEDGAPTAWSAPTLGATDADAGATLTWSVSSPASHGTATVSGTGTSPTTFTYAPTANWNGGDSFTVQVSDGNGGTDTIVVNVTVQAVNDPPVITQGAGPLSVTMSEDGAPTAWSAPTLGATDADAGATLTWSVSSPASHGTATVSGTGTSPTTFTYAPTANWNGGDSFTIQVSDTTGTDTITVNVTVGAVNDPPTITGQGALTTPE
ncbi:MAG TPA: tandem-95 repeat protein, partial [Candidatus Hydrogenedentes bacterium]|nr:tandem-95 repeat protein [Candidatus Hydrogenedentota bacterium]